MDFIEKAKIRIEHWITHNDEHAKEYDLFADQLQKAGKKQSAEYIRKMKELADQSSEFLKKALNSL